MIQTKKKSTALILLVLLAIYIIVLFKATVFKYPDMGFYALPGEMSGLRSLNLIPFSTIAEYLQDIAGGNIIIGGANVFGNLALFFPLGYMAALLFPGMRKWTRILRLALAVSLAIECCQFVFACGAADIDDVILNTLGGVAGYWFFILAPKRLKRRSSALLISALMIVFTYAGFQAFNNDAFYPMSSSLYAPGAPGGGVVDGIISYDMPGDAGGLAVDEIIAPGVPGDAGGLAFSERNVPGIQRDAGGAERNAPGMQRDAGGAASTGTDAGGKQNDVSGEEWFLVLVNKWNSIPENYEVELTEFAGGQSVDKRIYSALQDMFEAARSEGVYPIVADGYRSAEEQQVLLKEKIKEYKAAGYSAGEAARLAETWVAAPGKSEHQLGIAVDINADNIYSTSDEVYDWLSQNAWEFGFVRRYPPGKTAVTGVMNEPWHYRYVGVQAAEEMHKQGICFEEYLGAPTATMSR